MYGRSLPTWYACMVLLLIARFTHRSRNINKLQNPMKKTVLVLLSCLGVFSAAAAEAATKPHILFILVE